MKDTTGRMKGLMDTILRVRFTDLELERTCCQELLELSRANGSSYGKAFAFTYLGDYYLAQNDAEMSGQYLHWAREICTQHDYEVVHMKACHLSGFYYHLIYDEQSALQYYMEALALAEKLDNVLQICNTWNNIADMFQSRGALEDAKQYYLKAYETITAHRLKDNRMLLIVLYNLAEIVGISGDPNGMDEFLCQAEELEPEEEEEISFHRLCLLSSRCVQAALRRDTFAAVSIAQDILTHKLYALEDRYLAVELLLPIGQFLVELGEADYSQRYLALLTEYANVNSTSFMQRLLKLRVAYAEAFADEKTLYESYRDYCHRMQLVLAEENSVRVSGMKAKIHLQEVILQQETTRQENKELETAANFDALTAVHNRRYFDTTLESLFQGNSPGPLGIIMVDVDYFKEYNDTYGHIQGDCVLREVGAALLSLAPQGLIPCRFGGDEFSCICQGLTGETIEDYINCLRTRVAAVRLGEEGTPRPITLSIGYSNCLSPESAPALLAQADGALYQAKARGRNCWCKCEGFI